MPAKHVAAGSAALASANSSLSPLEASAPHELFPADGDDVPEVGWIHVTRLEPGGVKWCPYTFSATELPNLATVEDLYGGGKYEFIARSNNRNRITARRVYDIPGASKSLNPMKPGSAPEPVSQVQPVAAVAAPVPAPQAQGSNVMGIIAALAPILLPMLLEHMKNTQTERSLMMQQQQAMVQAMLQQMQNQSAAHVAAIQAVNTRGGGGGGGEESFLRGIEFMQSLINAKREEEQQKDGGGDATVLETLAQGMNLVNALKGLEGVPPGALASAMTGGAMGAPAAAG